MDFEVDGERQRALEFCPGCPSMQSPGVEPVHELTFAEKNKQLGDDPVLIVHVDPQTPAAYLSPDPECGWFLFSTLHVEVGTRGTTANWHVPHTANARAWGINAAIGGAACAEQPSKPAVRAQLADLVAEGCAGAELSPLVQFDRSVAISRELPSGVVIQALAALAQRCGADTAPWLMVLSDYLLADACDPKWSGELDDYASFRDEALNRIQLDLERIEAEAQCHLPARGCFGL